MRDAIADLMSVPLTEFVARRKEIAQALRKSGDRAAAERIMAMRKPSVVLWTANDAARRDPEALDVLLNAAADVEAAQAAALAGRSGAAADLRAASAGFQQSLDGLLQSATRGPEARQLDEAARRRVREILQAAALGSPADREALAGAHLAEEPPPLGFGGLTGLTVLQGGASSSPPAEPQAATAPTPTAGPDADAIARAAAEREAAEARSRGLVAAREAARQADAEASRAESQASRLEAVADAADEEARKRRREAVEARHDATQARARAGEAHAALDALHHG